jgi:hypothetical protein
MLATLPHHVSSWGEVQQLMRRLEAFLWAWTAARGGCHGGHRYNVMLCDGGQGD